MKGVEDALGRLDGVQHVQVDLQTNLVRIVTAGEMDLHLIPEAIRGAGFAPGEMRIRARGSFEGDAEPRFKILGWSRSLPVRLVTSPPGGEVHLEALVDTTGPEPVLDPVR